MSSDFVNALVESPIEVGLLASTIRPTGLTEQALHSMG